MKKSLLTSLCVRFLLVILLAAGVVPNVYADQYGHEQASCFTASIKSPGVIHFKMLVARKDDSSDKVYVAGIGNSTGQNTQGFGKIFISRPGHEDECILRFYSHLTSTSGDYGKIEDLSRIGWKAEKGVAVSTVPLLEKKPLQLFDSYALPNSRVIILNSGERAVFAEWDWYMPTEYIGSEPATFKVTIEDKSISPNNDASRGKIYLYSNVRNENTRTYTILKDVEIPNEYPEAPQTAEPQIAMEMGDGLAKPGMVMLPIIGAQNKLYSYTLPDKAETLFPKVDNYANIYLPASDLPRTNFLVNLKCTYNGGQQKVGDTNEELYNYYKTSVTFASIPAYHKIHKFKAEWVTDALGLRNGDVRLSWDIHNASYKDIMEDDIFVVERATKADFSDAEQINMIFYETGQEHYECLDQDDKVKGQDTQEDAFHYRVYRSSSAIWTDMDAVVDAGLAAISHLQYRYRACTTQEQREAEIIERLRKQVSVPFWDEQFTWQDNTHFELRFLSTKGDSLEFAYRASDTRTVTQATVESCTADKATDWATSRKVEVTAIVPFSKERFFWAKCPNFYIGTYDKDNAVFEYKYRPSLTLADIRPEENNIYWDKERTVLYLVRRMVTGTDTIEIETPVPADCIRYDTQKQCYVVHTSDVADIPCTRYEYYFRTDGSNNPLPLEKGNVSRMAEASSDFYFNDGIALSSLQASDRTSPDFTALQWETSGGDFEQYEIWRTPEKGSPAWSRIATVTTKSYEDSTAPVGIPCLYKVVGLLSCDAVVTDTTEVVLGQRDCYGSISGYVTYTNGSVRPGTEIHIVSATGDIHSVLTDENGYYRKDSLWFCEEGTSYQVLVPNDADNTFLSMSGAHLPLQITLSGRLATITDVNIQYTRCKRMEGRVLYEHSTVPVPHVQFLLDGHLMKDRNGKPLETDASGNFDLLVESGLHTVQAVKEGHTFANDGFFTDEKGNTSIDFSEDLYGKRLYDLTRIRVMGRLTGGLTEGSKPLGLGKSVNTLGDNLTLVMELEGDNTSRFVYYPTRTDITERDTVFQHLREGDNTKVHMEAKRITIHPDPRSGEFMVELFPARYKVTQVYATGYATLFAAGQTSQAIDMSDATHIEAYVDTVYHYEQDRQVHLPYHYRFLITYRNPINLRCQQVVYGMPKDYLGEAKMAYNNLAGTSSTVDLVKRDTLNQVTGYVFGYPIFDSQNMHNTYTFRISATEDYYYNNDTSSSRYRQETITGQNVTLFNGMSTAGETHRGYINPSTGYATITVQVNNPSFVLTGEQALRQMEIGMEVNGLYIYAEPIRGYVIGTRAKGVEAYKELTDELTLLDVIRDPYGAHSYAYVEAGTNYHASYRDQWDISGGVNIKLSSSTGIYQSTGVVLAPGGVGSYNGSLTAQEYKFNTEIPIKLRFFWFNEADYMFTTDDRIQTSDDPLMVGAMADIYVGTTHHRYAGLTDAISVIDSTQYRLLQPAIEAGTVHLLAEPQDSTPYYLVVGEQVEVGLTRPVTFAYTQKHIINNIIPRLLQMRDALLMTGTHVELQNLANATDTCVYRTLVESNDPLYGLPGGYEWITPQRKGAYVDEIQRYNDNILQWSQIIAQNEREKVEVQRLASMKSNKVELLDTYSVTSGADISHHETASYSHANDFHWRWTTTLAGAGGGLASFLGSNVASKLKELYEKKHKSENKFRFWGYEVYYSPEPLFEDEIQTKGVATFENSKTGGFVLATSDNSYEDISVYRLTDESFFEENKEAYEQAIDDTSEEYQRNYKYADFVFVREGGATHCPYEGEETTLFYSVGNKPVTLAPATLHIERPTISIDRRELSNVPMDQPATFVLTISNESDLTYDPNIPSTTFYLMQDQSTNPDGLTIKVDGQPIMNGLAFPLKIGESIQKTMQVYRGTAYDSDSVRIYLRPECDINLMADVNFNVHYQPVSCPVSMALPVQNWIMNTLSPKDDTGYYLPVEITDFDIHYDNFDHIDLQYKLQTQSDDQWTTQCSFYADSARYEMASGNKAMIENGRIHNVRFYGARDPMEQRYDLRAVSYCRLGNDFIMRSSELRSGLKDTRVPQLFGAATPANGILQVGDYISVPYSEDIAAYSLDEDYNFEVVGYTNQSEIDRSTSLTFDGSPSIYAQTELSHNLNYKDFSVDMWVMPARSDREMTYIMQGNNDTYIGLGQSYDPATRTSRLGVHMTDHDQEGYALSEPIDVTTDEWMHVVATYRSDDGHVELYLNGRKVTAPQDTLPPCFPSYAGVGPAVVGAHPAWPESFFEGRMLEARIWNKVLTETEVATTDTKRVSGYESALAAYYPFDEGQGSVATDKVGGTDLLLHGVTWTQQEGRALRLDDEALTLKGELFRLGARADFTYSMWFRIMEKADSVCLFDAGNMRLKLTPASLDLTMRVAGTTAEHAPVRAQGAWMDGQWHFVAVTANHSTGVGNLYVDDMNVGRFDAADVQASDGGNPVIGPMNGQIDDITFWEMALPAYYCQNFYRQTPNNSEMGLLLHLGFSERALSDDGDHYSTIFCPYNERIRRDELGNIMPRTEADRIIITDNEHLKGCLVDNAPIHEKGDLVKLGFNWICKDNELVINLKTNDRDINKQNIFITVRNVEDLAGNPQLSPLSWTLFVDRNSLRWGKKYLQAETSQGESETLTLDIINQGGTLTNYYIEQLPWWLTASAERGELSPLEQRPISFSVSDKLDPGEYSTIIYLTDEGGLTEPLRVQVKVDAHEPAWSVDSEFTNGQTMNLFAQVLCVGANGVEYFDNDTEDIVAAFLGNSCIGVEHIMMQNDRTLLCMSLQGSNDPSFIQAQQEKQPIRFLLWRAATGRIYALNPVGENPALYYEPNTWIGQPAEPIVLRTTDYRTQPIELQRGWNWISFYISPDNRGGNFSYALNGDYTFHNGDFIKMANISQNYEDGEWHGMPMQFFNRNVYMVRVSEDGCMGVQGFTTAPEQRNISLMQGWNNLPYLNESTQNINMALASYRLNGKPGDIVKGYHTFAMLDNNLQWVGTLTHLQPGMGYMLYRQDPSVVVMQYQTGGSETRRQAPARETRAESACFSRSHNMPVVATVAGAKAGDILKAYVDDELVGIAEADDQGRFMLMTSADEGSRISFRYLSDEGEKRATTVIRYRSATSSIGTLNHPCTLSFNENAATASPNPFDDHITYSGVTAQEGNIEIGLYNASGQYLWGHTLENMAAGSWQFTQNNTASYPRGIYIAVVRMPGGNAQFKLIKE